MAEWLDRCREIQGWMTDEDLNWLNNAGQTYHTIVEVGAWKGKSTYALCSANHAHITTVDHFMGTDNELDGKQEEAKTANIYDAFISNCGHFPNLKVLKMESTEAAKLFEPESVDVVFLDGDHSDENFMRDLTAWYPVAKKMICGHDMWVVKNTLAKFFGKEKVEEGAFWNDGVWYVIKNKERDFKMWEKPIKKTIFTLDIDNAYDKRITNITYPLMKAYAHKIGADFHIISERKFPEYPVTYEKCQVYELGQQQNNDWNIFFDCDVLIHPDFMDITNFMTKDFTAHNGVDLANVRWKYDRFFLRDGRNIGSPSWLCVASDWTIDLFKPLDDMTLAEVSERIFPILQEMRGGITPLRLIEDYLFSRNIAKYGLKFITVENMLKKAGYDNSGAFLWHNYNIPIDKKYILLRQVAKDWDLG